MNLEAYLGAEGQTITSDPRDFIPQWESRYRSWGAELSMTKLAGILELFGENLTAIFNAGKSRFTSDIAQAVANLAAQASAAIQALGTVFGDTSALSSQYPAQATRIKAAQDHFVQMLESLKEYGSAIAIADAQLLFVRQRDEAISKGELDSPLVHPDLKSQIVQTAYTKPETLLPGLAEKIQATYTVHGQVKPEAVTSSQVPVEVSVAPASPTQTGISPATSQKSPSLLTIGLGIVGAYVAFKALS